MRIASVILILAAFPVHAVYAQISDAPQLKSRIEQLERVGRIVVAGQTVQRSKVLTSVYQQSRFVPLWTDPRACADLVRVLHAVRDDGLSPEHYYLSTIVHLANTDAHAPDLELLRTAALIRVAYDLRRGKIDGSSSTTRHDYDGVLRTNDPVEDIRGFIQGGHLYDDVLALLPDHFVYRGLFDALARLRSIEAARGWVVIPSGPPLRRDSSDTRVPLLRQRLSLEGDLLDAVSNDVLFDAELEFALKSFQHRHGLNPDGVAGRATLAELNVPIGTRIDQVRVNLERARWITHDLPSSFVAVNVAGAMVYMIQSDQVVFETRAVVGRRYTATPVFRATLRSIELNPAWTVPPGIVGEVLSAIRRNPNYLRAQDIRVVNRSGVEIEVAHVDFSQYTARTFPYVFRQEPGTLNPLGRIKLVFPNKYNVYLHDTPSRALFAHEDRTFSHGCIRVQEPIRLAELVLGDSVRWSQDSLTAAIASGVSRTIAVSQPLPVLILYWTASADLHGEVHFYRDVYGRDPPLLRALNTR